jgi:hypothetical protein
MALVKRGLVYFVVGRTEKKMADVNGMKLTSFVRSWFPLSFEQ